MTLANRCQAPGATAGAAARPASSQRARRSAAKPEPDHVAAGRHLVRLSFGVKEWGSGTELWRSSPVLVYTPSLPERGDDALELGARYCPDDELQVYDDARANLVHISISLDGGDPIILPSTDAFRAAIGLAEKAGDVVYTLLARIPTPSTTVCSRVCCGANLAANEEFNERTVEWTAAWPSESMPLLLTTAIISEFRRCMAADAPEGGATAASMCAAASDAHVAFRFEERADGKVRVIVVSGTVFMIWPDIFELCNVREGRDRADVSSASVERVAPTPFHYRCPFCERSVAGRSMNDLSALLAHMGRCCPNDDAAPPRASAPPRSRRRPARTPPSFRRPRARCCGRRPRPSRGSASTCCGSDLSGPSCRRAPGLDAMIGSARAAPMTERIDVFCRSMSGLSVKWGGTESLLSLERNVKTHGNVYGLRGGAGSSDLDDRQQPTLQTIAATNDVLVPPGTHRNSRLALQPYSGSYPDGIMRAYEAVPTRKFADDVALDPAAAMETLMAGRQMVSGVDFSHLVLVGTNLSFPVAKHFTPPKGGGKAADLRHIGRAWSSALVCNRCRGTRWADDCVSSRLCATGECVYRPPTAARCATDAPCDECRALGHTTANGRLRACRRSLEAKAQCRRFAVLVVTADGEHSAAVNACNEYVAAFVDGSVPQPLEALISAAPGLREFLRAERPLCLVDFVHSLRRIWGKSQDYFLLSGDELVSTHLLMALRSFAARPHEWVKHLSTKALRAKNRLCSQSVVSLGRLLLERLVATDAPRGVAVTVVPETYLVWKKDLRHNLVRSPCALACATKSTLVFVVTREGSVLAVTNKQPATVSLVAGRARATTPATAVPKKASTKRSAPGALALVNPTGVAMFDNDRYLVVADFGQPAALIVVEYPRRWVSTLPTTNVFRLSPPPAYSHSNFCDIAAVGPPTPSRTQSVVVAAFEGEGRGAVLVAELKFDLSPAAAIVVKHRVDLGGGEPCQLCVNAGGTMCFVTVWDATSGRVVAVDFEDAAARRRRRPERLAARRLRPSGVANVLLAGGDVAGDRDGALPHAQLDQPLGLVTSPHGRASVYVASAAGHCAGSVRLFNFGTTGLRKLMANLRAIGEACVLPDDYGYIRRNLGALPFDSVDAYRAHVHRRPFREAVAAMTAAIESIVADMDVMGAAISRSGGVNATKGPDATPAFQRPAAAGAGEFERRELGTAADVVALEPRAIEDALQNGSRTTWDTRKPGDGKTFYVTPEGGKAVPWEDVDAIVKPLRTAKAALRRARAKSARGDAVPLQFFPNVPTLRPGKKYANVTPVAPDNMLAQAPRPRRGRENAVLERCDGMDDGAAALRFACSDGAARDGGHADGHGPRDRARAGPGRGRLGSGLGVL
ncbi:hypothetical protein JL720_7931 [Aureococcus anophagefferens]|nr:hypothetical protein JL720_7931 [Aureococcus anophagefferens]